MADTNTKIQFQCPKCGGNVCAVRNKKILCMTEDNGMGGCDGAWKVSEALTVFVLVRRFASKLDYNHYRTTVGYEGDWVNPRAITELA